jgi:gliding motility-associated-like protein
MILLCSVKPRSISITTGFTPTAVLWESNSAYTLSCNTCVSPVTTMLDSGMVNLQLTNQYGCVVKGIDCAEPVATATSSMKYLVTATNNYYCKDTASVLIQTFVKTGIVMPNAFSPNGDGRNDYLYVMGGLDIRKVKNLTVFNRYGQKLFESTNSPANDRNYGWDGRVKGKRADFGTYVYSAAVEYLDGSVQYLKGTIILLP